MNQIRHFSPSQLIALTFAGLILAGALNGLILPLVLGALLLASRKKTIVGDYQHPRFLSVTGWIIFAVMLCLAVETAGKLLPKLLG